MLNDREQRVLDQMERSYGVDAAEPVRSGATSRRPRPRAGRRPLPVAVAACAGPICALLLAAGAVDAALALAAAVALGWLLWRYWPELSDEWAGGASSTTEDEMADGPPPGSVR